MWLMKIDVAQLSSNGLDLVKKNILPPITPLNLKLNEGKSIILSSSPSPATSTTSFSHHLQTYETLTSSS